MSLSITAFNAPDGLNWYADMTGRCWLVREDLDKGRVVAIVFKCGDGHAEYARNLWCGQIVASNRFEYGVDVGLYVSADTARDAVSRLLVTEATPSTGSEPSTRSAPGHDFDAIMQQWEWRDSAKLDRSTLPPAGSAWIYAHDDSGWYVKAPQYASTGERWKRIVDYDVEPGVVIDLEHVTADVGTAQIDRSAWPPEGSEWEWGGHAKIGACRVCYARDGSGWCFKTLGGSTSDTKTGPVPDGWERIVDYDDEIQP